MTDVEIRLLGKAMSDKVIEINVLVSRLRDANPENPMLLGLLDVLEAKLKPIFDTEVFAIELFGLK